MRFRKRTGISECIARLRKVEKYNFFKRRVSLTKNMGYYPEMNEDKRPTA